MLPEFSASSIFAFIIQLSAFPLPSPLAAVFRQQAVETGAGMFLAGDASGG